ncbi:MAG: 16S rRNA (guanine(527)-N(7))-methyltransferase RsmG [Desulfobacteraceae bacterium]|nr:16S rRNA (guanine(527)-N(7))-methyltransferase RsmG [Desulfobacteraceae bacterium]
MKQTKKNKPESHPTRQGLARIFEQCDVALTRQQAEQFWTYHELLRRHNPDLNLTRIHNFENMVLKLYVDSVLPAQLIELASPLMDLGTGPGMPGIPLKIMHPKLEMVLAEARANRVEFIQEVINTLELKQISVIHRKMTADFSMPVAGVITRAVEKISQTMERVQGCLEQSGHLIFMKGPGCEDEIKAAEKRYGKTFQLLDDKAYTIGNTPHKRRLVVFKRLDQRASVQVDRAGQRHKIYRIESKTNQRFKSLKKLLSARGLKKSGQAIMSGARPIREVMARFPKLCSAWITIDQKWPPPDDSPATMDWIQLPELLFHELDSFGTKAPLLCIHIPEIEPWDPEQGFIPGCNLIIPFQDPANVGACIRSAAAFGAAQVILLSESAHPYHPKALRASGGVTPLVTMRQGPALEDLPEHLPVVALSAEGKDLSQINFPTAFGLLAGLEGQGLPGLWRNSCVKITIRKEVESLNAAAAVSIALYEWKQRIR